MHIAQLNIAKLRYPIDDPRVGDFVANLDRINGAAERSPGFVWRFQDETGNATEIRAFDDPNLIVNMSVWQSPEDLERFVWQTAHKRIYNRKAEWFEHRDEPYFVMWLIGETHIPDLDEALERLDHLRRHGASDHAFGWAHLPHVRLWRDQRCA